jgi:alpha-amylase
MSSAQTRAMKRTSKSSFVFSFPLLAGLACLLPGVTTGGCVSIDSQDAKPIIATHVADWRDEVIYQILVDRFADGDVNNDYSILPGALAKYQGGDWKGIEDHLDYLQSLGVTTLWISPVVRNISADANIDGYHGYWQENLSEINPYFGDMSSLRSMTAAAHEAGMKVVLDIVCNHMGQVFFYDINKNGLPDVSVYGSGGPGSPLTQVSEYAPDYDPNGVQSYSSAGGSGRAPIIFINDPTVDRVLPGPGILGSAEAYHGKGQILSYDNIDDQPDEEVMTGDFPGGLKDIATENEEVRATLADAFATWVEQADFDGFRIDTVKHVEHSFWTEFGNTVRQRLKAEGKNNFLMFGEAFDGDDILLGSYTQPGQLDSVFYFSQHYTVFQRVFEWAHDHTMQQGTDQIQQLWDAKTVNYGSIPQTDGVPIAPYKLLVNFLDNHDVPRFLYDSAGDLPALRNALTLNVMAEGIPCIYYGTEQEFNGGNDPANREVLWNTGFPTTGDTFTHIAKLTAIRKQYIALRRGDTKVIWSSPHVGTEQDAGIFAFERAGGDAGSAYALVVMNTNDTQTSSTANGTTTMLTTLKGKTVLVDVLDPNQAKYTVDSDSTLSLTLKPQTSMILIPQANVVASN